MRIVDSLVDPIINPTVFIGSFEWREPITSLTDALVSIVCMYAFIVFTRYKGEKSASHAYFKIFFLLFGLGMLSSASFGHALVAYFSPAWKAIGWSINSFAFLFLGFAVLKEIEPITKPTIHKIIKVTFVLQVFIFVFLIINPLTRNFIYAQLCSTTSLILMVLPMQIFNFIKTKSKGSLIFIVAILCGLLPALSFNLQISINRWFNYHDISHVFMAIIIFLMYLGASRMSFKKNHD